jgi:hypothetical protein
MKTNDLKKGAYVRLRNGWYAQIADNKRGNIRMATVYGLYTETGSVYAHDIAEVVEPLEGDPEPNVQYLIDFSGKLGSMFLRIVAEVEHTPAQIKLREEVDAY